MSSNDPIKHIEELFKLLKEGHISQEEYDMLKAKIILDIDNNTEVE